MVDEIQRASSSLKELNDNALAGEKIFSGFLGTMVEVAAGTEGASKAWTTLSRLTSGSPIWKLQNKARAYLSILAGFQERALRAENAQRMQNKAAVDAILNVDKLTEEYRKLKLAAGSYNKEQEEALQSTVAFSEAIISGKSKSEAYKLSLASLGDLVKNNSKEVNTFLAARKKAAKFEENLQTAKGRGRIKAGIQSQKRKAYSMLTGEGFNTGSVKGERESVKGVLKAIVGTLTPKKEETPFSKIFKLYKSRSSFSETVSKFSLKFQKRMLKVVMGLQPLFKMAFNFLIYAMLGILAFLVFAKVAYDIFDIIKDFGALDDINAIITSAVSIVGNLFTIIGAFLSGDFETILSSGLAIVNSVIDIAYKAGLLAAKAGLAILVGLFYSLLDFMDYFFFQEGYKVVLPALYKIGKFLLAAYFVRWIAGQALLLLGIYALPIGMAIVIGAAFLAFYRKVAGHPVLEMIVFGMTAIIGILAFVAGGWIIAAGAFVGLLLMGLAKKFKFFAKATGGTSHGGMTLVGEQGPELVNLPAGAQVKTNSQTNRMMGGTTVNNYITINAKDTSKAEMRRIATELGNMINTKMNRTGATRTMR